MDMFQDNETVASSKWNYLNLKIRIKMCFYFLIYVDTFVLYHLEISFSFNIYLYSSENKICS